MNSLLRAALSWLRPVWRQILVVHLVYIGLGFIVFAPLLGALGQVLLKMSGESVLADMDLLFFALSPTGLFAFGLFTAVSIVIIVFELASLMAIGVAAANGQSIDVLTALGFSFKRLKPIFQLAVRLLLKLLIIFAPFLLVAAAVGLFLLTDHDINYYLATQPVEFWIAAVIIAVIVLLMAVLLMRRLISWSLTLPLVLFVGIPPPKSFEASASLTKKNGGMILRVLATWAVAALLLGVAVTLSVRILAHLIVLFSIDSVSILALLFGLLAVFWLVAGLHRNSPTSGYPH